MSIRPRTSSLRSSGMFRKSSSSAVITIGAEIVVAFLRDVRVRVNKY